MKWLLLAKPWLAPTLALLVVAAVGGSWWHGYQTGKKVTNAEVLAELEAARSEQARLTDELEEAQQKRRIVYRDRTRTVYREPDPTGCDLVRAPERVLESLGYADRPEADGTSGATGAARPNE